MAEFSKYMLGMALMGSAASGFGQVPAQDPNAKLIARGKYLVDNAGQCSDCHTPMTQKGEFDKTKWLHGAPLMFKPTVPIPNFADKSLGIAGLPDWRPDDAVKFLMTGIDEKGKPRKPPMPQYRFNKADATAIMMYLKSLPPAPK